MNIIQTRVSCILLTLFFALTSCSIKKQAVVTNPIVPIQVSAIKQFSDVISAPFTVNKGLFTVYKKGERFFYDIPDSLLGREMLVVTRFVKTPPGVTVQIEQYGGEKENEQVWKWERHKNQIFIRVQNYAARADKNSSMELAVGNSNLEDILYAFDIKASDKDKSGVIIDVTDFYNGDVQAISVSDKVRRAYKIGGLDNTRSYIDTIKSFPLNIEAHEVKTYSAAESPTDVSNASMTFELNTSMLLLPRIPMKPRLFDERVYYINKDHIDYSSDAQKAEATTYIHRWKLEPKDEAAYQRGELVEPKKQIVFYIDPATPAKWVPYLIAGINDWQKAFEAAGFKNAIVGKPAPTKEEDPEFSTEDSRYSMIRYFASDIPNAYGLHVADPRTGEIMESHIGWYYNDFKDEHDWYFIQTAAANPAARKPQYTTEEMGQLIRITAAHEVGHTLGLPHNWASNYAYPVDSLRSKTFTDKHGTAASIMDYARFNYVAQPGDGITQFSPKIGEYDFWAIKWGYTWFPGNKTAAEEKEILNKWTSERSGNPLYLFGMEFTGYDPRIQNEDIGDDAMKAGTYGIANLKRILPNIEKWNYVKGQNLEDVKDYYNQVLSQFNLYLGHVTTNVGGMYVNYKTFDDPIAGYTYVSKTTQQRAVNFLKAQVFTTPWWLIDSAELKDIDNGVIINRIRNIQVKALDALLSPSRMSRMINNQVQNGDKAYSIQDLFADLRPAVFGNAKPDAFSRNLQRGYIARLQKLLTDDFTPDPDRTTRDLADHGATPVNIQLSDIRPAVRAELVEIEKRLPNGMGKLAVDHYSDLKKRISYTLMDKRVKSE